MRAMNIKAVTGKTGWHQAKASFAKNHLHYLQEAIGLAVFMISAALFGSLLEAKTSWIHLHIPNANLRSVIMGVMMGSTALFIFYSPFTSPSGSHINPAVTLTFWRLNRICPWDTLFYILFQFIGGTLAVYLMKIFLGSSFTMPPVNYATTIPGNAGVIPAMLTEFFIAVLMMSMVLFTTENAALKKHTRIIAGTMVCLYVIFAGPVSGFGMNPARSFASALPANTWTAFWIYLFIPIAGMFTAAELFLKFRSRSAFNQTRPANIERET